MCTNEQNKSFEENMKRLEQIVQAMERGDITLDESLKLFQEGASLVERCGKLLEEAEMMVTKVLANENGEVVEESFADESI